ncbi:MAG: hypothetical protein RPT11_07170 [Bermanella sp.]
MKKGLAQYFTQCVAAPALLLAAVSAQGKDYYLELDINKGHNSNVFLEADDDIVLADTFSQQDIQTQIGVMGSYEFFDGEHSDAEVTLDYFTESFAANDLDSTITSVSVPYTYYTNQYRIRITPAIMRYRLSGEDALHYNSGRLDVTRKLGTAQWGAQYGYSKKTAQDVSFLDYQGSSQNIKTHVTFRRFGSSLRLNLNLFSNDYEDAYSSNDGYSVQASYQQRFRHTGYRVSAKFKDTQYIADPLLDDVARNDGQLSIGYTQDYYLNAVSELYFNSEYVTNDSNVALSGENYSYHQWVNSLGMRFVF